MARIVIETRIDATISDVWNSVEVISTHVDWMVDATEIRFLTDQTSGVGTSFECDTRVGPFTTTDVMRITAWEPEARMGVEHIGLVTGRGDFFLTSNADGSTTFTWDEELHFPWFLAGPLGELAAKPILAFIWRRNLRTLKKVIEGDSGSS